MVSQSTEDEATLRAAMTEFVCRLSEGDQLSVQDGGADPTAAQHSSNSNTEDCSTSAPLHSSHAITQITSIKQQVVQEYFLESLFLLIHSLASFLEVPCLHIIFFFWLLCIYRVTAAWS